MADFNQPILTDQGRQLLLNAGGGTGKLTWTKAVLYGQNVNNLNKRQIARLTGLEDDLLETNIGVKDVDANSVTIVASFTNSDLTRGIQFNAAGWFGKIDDGQEVLAIISPTTAPEPFPAAEPDKQSTAVVNLEQTVTLADGTIVNLNVNAAGTIKQADLDNAIAIAKTQLTRNFVDYESQLLKQNYIEINLEDHEGNQLLGKEREDLTAKYPLVRTDSSLSESGSPADAKTIGEQITNIQDDVIKNDRNIEKLRNDAQNTFATQTDYRKLDNSVRYNADNINSLNEHTATLENGLINNQRLVDLLGHDGRGLAAHDSSGFVATTQYLKIDKTLQHNDQAADAGSVGQKFATTEQEIELLQQGLVNSQTALQGITDNSYSVTLLGHAGNPIASSGGQALSAKKRYFDIDPTLSKAGQAADAQATGNAIKAVFMAFNATLNAIVAGLDIVKQQSQDITNRLMAVEDKVKTLSATPAK